jgi:hypothetical protein
MFIYVGYNGRKEHVFYFPFSVGFFFRLTLSNIINGSSFISLQLKYSLIIMGITTSIVVIDFVVII